MLKELLPKIPQHELYVEPFFGGGALFWAKQPSAAEVVNDINHRLVTFYKVLKYDFEALKELVDETFHARHQHIESGKEYVAGKDEVKDQVAMAWAVWVQTNMSFGSNIGAGFGYDRGGKCALKLFNKKEVFQEAYKLRLKKTTIECYDVLKVIKAYDSPNTFFYLDPPYVSANQGCYAGYTEADFRNLLEACTKLQGKFLLSSYPETILAEYRKAFNWQTEDIVKTLAVDGRRKENKTKTECLTWNYNAELYPFSTNANNPMLTEHRI